MNMRSWWRVQVRMGVVYLPHDQGDRLAERWEAHKVGLDMHTFVWRGVNESGSEVLISLDDITHMEESTPAARVAELEEDGFLEEIRAWSRAVSAKRWSAESYE